MSYYEAFDYRGSLKAIRNLSEDNLISIRCSFAQLERANIIFSVAGSLFRGDYFEFGCLDLHSFINTINACRINDLDTVTGEQKRFYGFDVFGDTSPTRPETKQRHQHNTVYFNDFKTDASLDQYYDRIKKNGIYVERCKLVKGFFNETFTADYVSDYLREGRKAGFVFIDCNIPESYTSVFENLAPILRDDAWIYLDEYLEQPQVTVLFEQFRRRLAEEKNLGTVLAKSAGGWGSLFRCYKNTPVSFA